MIQTKYTISLLGSSGFIGQSLLQHIKNATGLSLRDPSWKAFLKETDVIINLVGKAHDHQGTATEQDYYDANVELAKEVFEAFSASDAKLLIHVSSLAALEEFESSEALTEQATSNPTSWYGKSKRAAEEWLLAQELAEDKRLIILRPPMVHGAGDKGNLGLLYKLISKGIPYPLAVFNNERSFISIDNFCFFIQQLLEKRERIESGIYHISDDESIATSDIIQIIKSVTGKNTMKLVIPKKLVELLARFGDIIPIPLNSKRLKKMTSSLVVSNQKIKTALGIEKLPLTAEEGLIKTIQSFRGL
ncbi:NAD-dependent epimerase/dehydratase family protein [Sphingobacterium sp. MYb382]|uniref:NAD-dependent epimerase/dehydratase family protein n=1 Tax=Sphingobacterium sp. MYb382 TaxID=2745278 RepID=UPI0030AB2E80